MILYTIGFTKTSAKHFFERLEQTGVRTLIDVRLNNVSQLAGFAKREDLRFFTSRILGAEYRHEASLAPTERMLAAYRKKEIDWGRYSELYLGMITDRRVSEHLQWQDFDNACLLCSEAAANQCHRRLAGEHLQSKWPSVRLVHL